jgi:hypothetical protein
VPTNKLWLEHTEQAAWQSVEALREKLALAEQRQARLAPPVEGWQSLLDVLDQAKSEHAVAGENYAAILRELLERLSALSAQARALEQARVRELSTAPLAAIVEGAAWRASRASRARSETDDDEEREADAPAPSESRLFREIRDRYGKLTRGRGREDASALLADIEARLDDLPDLDPAELSEVAADLGALSLLLTRGSHSDD